MAIVTVQMPIKHIEAVAHQVPSSERLHDAVGQETFRWMLSDTERAHICKLLNIDEATFSNTAGFVFDREREICAGCGKYSGHDDLVDTALKMKVHSPEFILDGLLTGKPSPVAHPINCSSCGKTHEGTFRWPGVWGDHERHSPQEVEKGAFVV